MIQIERQRQEAKEETTSPQRLSELAVSTDLITRQYVAKNPNVSKETLFHLGAEFPQELLNNPVFELLIKQSPELIDRIPPPTFAAIICQKNVTQAFFKLAVNHTDSIVQNIIANDPATPPEILQQLLEKNLQTCNFASVSLAIAENPNTASQTLQFLADQSKDIEIAKQTIYSSNIEIPAEVIVQLAENADENLLEAIARHPNTPEQIMENLCSSYSGKNHQIIGAICHNPNTSSEILESIVNRYISNNSSHTRDLLYEIANHANTFLETLDRLTSYPDNCIVEAVAANPNISEKILLKTVIVAVSSFFPQASQKEKQNLLVQAFNDLHKAKHPETSTSLLKQFTTHRWSAVRLAVAKNSNTPDSILKILANDPNYNVCISVGKHPNSSKQTLEIVTNCPVSYVRNIAVRHPNISRVTKQRTYIRHQVNKWGQQFRKSEYLHSLSLSLIPANE